MGVKKLAEQYETSDGEKWAVENDAVRHQAFLDAWDHFDTAKKILNRVLAERATTADGKPFDFRVWTYYWLSPGYWAFPSLTEVTFRPNECSFHEKRGAIVVSAWRSGGGAGGAYERKEYPVAELYADRRAANLALFDAREKRLEELTVQLAADRAALG